VELPLPVPIGADLEIAHGGFGIVIHSRAQIGNRVKLYPGVTLGRADIYKPASESSFEGIVIEDDVILSPGCKVLCKDGVLRVGRGTVIGANAVLLQSTGKWEIWAGMPAIMVGKREPSP
jgi:serine O-acetyltransferase